MRARLMHKNHTQMYDINLSYEISFENRFSNTKIEKNMCDVVRR
jgi:hypothetical protein